MPDPREFSDMSDNPENTGWFGQQRDEEDLYLDEIVLDEDVEEEN